MLRRLLFFVCLVPPRPAFSSRSGVPPILAPGVVSLRAGTRGNSMYIHAAVVADLHHLKLHQFGMQMDGDDGQLPHLVQLLERAAGLSVSSLLGWRLELRVEGKPLVMTSVHPGPVLASWRVPLGAVSPVWSHGFLTLFAAQADAFVIFSRDVAAALHVPGRRFRLDEDLKQDLTSGVTGISGSSAAHQAVGVLIDHGHTITAAGASQRRQATVTDLPSYRTAGKMIRNF
jgi:hypothetical protein